MNYDTIEYSVCQDCLLYIAYGDLPDSGNDTGADIARELNGKEGHFNLGIESTEDDPEGNGYNEFSWQECELCRSTLGVSRHGVTLMIKLPEKESQP